VWVHRTSGGKLASLTHTFSLSEPNNCLKNVNDNIDNAKEIAYFMNTFELRI
jgi:hypothetical protein